MDIVVKVKFYDFNEKLLGEFGLNGVHSSPVERAQVAKDNGISNQEFESIHHYDEKGELISSTPIDRVNLRVILLKKESK